MISFIDNFLNKITMYRLVLYYLIVLLLAALVFGFFGILPFSPINLAFSSVVILAACWIVNTLFAKAFDATTNVESVYITAFILALIITPVAPTNYVGIGFLVFASAWAMASKYILAIGKKHLFNPAAFGVALSALAIGQSATWWVGGNLFLLPIVVLGGLLIVRKIRRFDLAISFMVVALVTIVVTAGSSDWLTPLTQTLLHAPLFFFAFLMLTEPLTMPAAWYWRVVYAAIVGFLFAPNIHLGSFYFTPEIALLAGNLFAYAVSPKGRFILKLVDRKKLGTDTYEFAFAPDRTFRFRPGQYLEWTLAHSGADTRGNRRYFTIASSPAQDTVNLGIKFYKPASSFKRALATMKLGDTISASQLSGEFVLPVDTKKKLVFIAGGIGVTPFVSMVQDMLDTKIVRPVVLLYGNKTLEEVAYKDLFDRAGQEIGLKTVHALSSETRQLPGFYNGFIDAALIAREVPDYADRMFYLSGPHSMVEAFKKTLKQMGIPRSHIKTDYFPGFV